MAHRDRVKRLQRKASEHVDSFELRDGSRYFYNRLAASRALYIYAYDLENGVQDAQAPDIWIALKNATGPQEVLSRFRAPKPGAAAVDLDALYASQVDENSRRKD